MKRFVYKSKNENGNIEYTVSTGSLKADNLVSSYKMTIPDHLTDELMIYEWCISNLANEESLESKRARLEQVASYKLEKEEITKWFSDNDYKVNKVVVGEWQNTDQRYQEYLLSRKQMRNRQDELNIMIGLLEKAIEGDN